MQANDKNRPRFRWGRFGHRRRGLRNRCSTRLTTKLTVAPTAAKMTVLSSSSAPMWGSALSSVPAAVPSLRSWRIGSLLSRHTGRHSLPARAGRRLLPAIEAVPNTQRHAHELGGGNHLGRQPHRRGDNQLAGQLQPLPQRYPPRYGRLSGCRPDGRGIRRSPRGGCRFVIVLHHPS